MHENLVRQRLEEIELRRVDLARHEAELEAAAQRREEEERRKQEALVEASELEGQMARMRADLAEKRRQMLEQLEAKKLALLEAKKAKEEARKRLAEQGVQGISPEAQVRLSTPQTGSRKDRPDISPGRESAAASSGAQQAGALGRLTDDLRKLQVMREQMEKERQEQLARFESERARLKDQMERDKAAVEQRALVDADGLRNTQLESVIPSLAAYTAGALNRPEAVQAAESEIDYALKRFQEELKRNQEQMASLLQQFGAGFLATSGGMPQSNVSRLYSMGMQPGFPGPSPANSQPLQQRAMPGSASVSLGSAPVASSSKVRGIFLSEWRNGPASLSCPPLRRRPCHQQQLPVPLSVPGQGPPTGPQIQSRRQRRTSSLTRDTWVWTPRAQTRTCSILQSGPSTRRSPKASDRGWWRGMRVPEERSLSFGWLRVFRMLPRRVDGPLRCRERPRVLLQFRHGGVDIRAPAGRAVPGLLPDPQGAAPGQEHVRVSEATAPRWGLGNSSACNNAQVLIRKGRY